MNRWKKAGVVLLLLAITAFIVDVAIAAYLDSKVDYYRLRAKLAQSEEEIDELIKEVDQLLIYKPIANGCELFAFFGGLSGVALILYGKIVDDRAKKRSTQ